MAREFKLPDLGSGLKEGEIVSWLVKVGDEVTTDDLLCEVETEKAVIEIPVPYDGTVISLAVEAGESVKVGGVLAVFGIADEPQEHPSLREAYLAPLRDSVRIARGWLGRGGASG